MNDLLKILDMSEDEQWEWLYDNHKELVNYRYIIDKQKHLADLAFRLRDEVGVIGHLHEGIKAVCEISCLPNKDYVEWWMYEAKPIHWVIASLIAKGKANEDMP